MKNIKQISNHLNTSERDRQAESLEEMREENIMKGKKDQTFCHNIYLTKTKFKVCGIHVVALPEKRQAATRIL
ncbi:CLUMA_CG004058, isoform A [Clunio marinus]|uniref:CLUMA_CG004058, isoform A n=1 Tax=Clunio marinus TaxID=568069 RepID=A0A1J1HSN2_9DIPT|nr:CLUMA_CG004058, isoform A [Clunio marinus]